MMGEFLGFLTIYFINLRLPSICRLRYGFVTFAEASCAYEVIDKFTKDPLIKKYDIRFGGRRRFCKQTYADLGAFSELFKQIQF